MAFEKRSLGGMCHPCVSKRGMFEMGGQQAMYSVKYLSNDGVRGVRGPNTTISTLKHARPVFAAAYFEMQGRYPENEFRRERTNA